MKAECSIEKIKDAVLKTERIVGRNQNLPTLASIFLNCNNNTLTIKATNLSLALEIEIPAKVTQIGSVLIKSETIGGFFTNLNSDGQISLEATNGVLLLKTKNTNTKIKTEPTGDFPTIPSVVGTKIILSTAKLIDGLRSVYYAASVSDIKPEISSVYFYKNDDSLIFVATDSFRLAEKKIKSKNLADFASTLIPFKNVGEIIRLLGGLADDITVVVDKNLIAFHQNGLYLTSRTIDGSFPDYGQIIPKDKKTEAVVLKQDLLSALKVSNIFSDKFNQINIKINPNNKLFQIEAQNQNTGENQTTIDAALSGEPIEIGLNLKYLLDCFQSVGQDSIFLRFNQNNKPVTVGGVGDNSFLYLIMPMNR